MKTFLLMNENGEQIEFVPSKNSWIDTNSFKVWRGTNNNGMMKIEIFKIMDNGIAKSNGMIFKPYR